MIKQMIFRLFKTSSRNSKIYEGKSENITSKVYVKKRALCYQQGLYEGAVFTQNEL